MKKRGRPARSAVVCSLLYVTGCGAGGLVTSDQTSGEPGPGGEPALVGSSVRELNVLSTLNTFIDRSLEIDRLSGGPGDANLFVGLDPADNTASAQLPTGGPATFIDWDDLGGDLANHRL